jgi:hypothetical protein
MRTALLTTALALCLAASPAFIWAQHEDATAKRLTVYVESFNQELSKGNIDAWMALFADRAERKLPGGVQQGLPEIRAAYQGLLETYTGFRLVELSRKVKGHEAVAECQFEAVYKANGNKISQPVRLTIHFDIFGKITSLRADYDPEALAKQMRASRA